MSDLWMPIAAGALSYAVAQFLWYSPRIFGGYCRSLKAGSDDAATELFIGKNGWQKGLLGIILPAFLVSCALTALSLVVVAMRGSQVLFLFLAVSLGVSAVLPKYLFKRPTDVDNRPRTLEILQDGALLFGILGSAFAIIVMQ